MSDEKGLTVQEPKQVVVDGHVVDLAEWRSRDEIVAMGRRIMAYVPGCDKLTEMQAFAFAQYCLVMDLNPFHGDAYAFQDKHGKLVISDGYKAIMRWARGRHPFTHRFGQAPGIPDRAIGYRCYIMRKDAREAMGDYVRLGATFKEALELCEVYADGIILPQEMEGYNKPPKGWTWDERARTRALKSALSKSHGTPSPKEVAEGSWNVNGTQTQPEDWQGPGFRPGMPQQDQELVAEFNAQVRESRETPSEVTASQAMDELFGEYEHDGEQPVIGDYVEETPPEPPPNATEQAHLVPNWVNDPDVTKRFYTWVGKQMLPNGEVISKTQIYEAIGVESSLKEFTGTPGEAKTMIRKWIDDGIAEAE